jgi:hypothetical protein
MQYILQEADLALLGVFPYYNKYHKVDYTIPWFIDSIKIVAPFPKEDDEIFFTSIIRPFQTNVFKQMNCRGDQGYAGHGV